MLNPVLVMLEGGTCIVWRIDEDTLDSACVFLFKSFQSKQVVAKYQPIVEEVILRNTLGRMVRKRWVFKQNPRLQPRPILLPDPRQF
jgi:hypothetical protein